MRVIKKDGTLEEYDSQKIINAVNKSAARVMVTFTDKQKNDITTLVLDRINEMGLTDIPISEMHNLVEYALCEIDPKVAKSYRDYRNYKVEFVHMMDKIYEKSQAIRYIGDKENANTDSALVATQRSLIYGEVNKRMYRKFFMTLNEKQACRDGYIYIHDQSARLDTINCCLFNAKEVMSGGFEMGNIFYNEPKTLDTAFDVLGDIILSTASQQYGGFTVPEIDQLLSQYAWKSYWIYHDEYIRIKLGVNELPNEIDFELNDDAEIYAMKKVTRECEQGYQGIEMKLNTVGSSRGDYPFITITFGLSIDEMGKMISKTILKVHRNGQGKPGFKRPVLFPKLVFLYDEKLHAPGGYNNDIFEEGILCSASTMYPDWLSLTGEGYVPSMYKKYGRVVSPMGKCKSAHVKRY